MSNRQTAISPWLGDRMLWDQVEQAAKVLGLTS